MKFGLLYEVRIAKPWHERSEYEVFQEIMEQSQLAEELGIEYVWGVEHHFSSEASHSSAPEVWLAALSQRTKRIRLGFAVILLPFPFNHPVRAAERAATLDLVSGGRVEVGTGRSYSARELEGFGIDPADARPMWEEAVHMLPKMWTQETFSWNGKYFKVPERPILPKPMQKPHPPMWVACTQPDTFTIAGQYGLGCLCGVAYGKEELSRRVGLYRQAVKQATPVGAFVNNQVGFFTQMYCGETDNHARNEAGEALLFTKQFGRKYSEEWKARADQNLGAYSYYAKRDISKDQQRRADVDLAVKEGGSLMGSPDTIIRQIREFEAMGADQVLMLVQMGKITHQQIMASLRRFGKHVAPAFQKSPAGAR